jgi:hypothetical protein
VQNRPRLVYATGLIDPRQPGERVPRVRQSAAASRLLETLAGHEGPPLARSKSHSRSAVAVAMSAGAECPLGIDIEWITPARPIAAIAGNFLGDTGKAIGVADFYRGWTFYEAFFKAFQRPPSPLRVLELIERPDMPSVHCLSDGTKALQHRIGDAFQLSLVWFGNDDSVPLYREDLRQY